MLHNPNSLKIQFKRSFVVWVCRPQSLIVSSFALGECIAIKFPKSLKYTFPEGSILISEFDFLNLLACLKALLLSSVIILMIIKLKVKSQILFLFFVYASSQWIGNSIFLPLFHSQIYYNWNRAFFPIPFRMFRCCFFRPLVAGSHYTFVPSSL